MQAQSSELLIRLRGGATTFSELIPIVSFAIGGSRPYHQQNCRPREATVFRGRAILNSWSERRCIYLGDSYNEFYHVIARRRLGSEKDRSELRET